MMSLGVYLKNRACKALKLRCRPAGALDLWVADDWEELHLLADTLVLPWCVVLSYQRLGWRRTETRVFLPDSLNGNDFRRFRVWLRYRATVLPSGMNIS